MVSRPALGAALFRQGGWSQASVARSTVLMGYHSRSDCGSGIRSRDECARDLWEDQGRGIRASVEEREAPSHLCRAFRAHLDATPTQCARLMRLDRAIARLERSDDAIKEISKETGFANTFHFSRCFTTAFRLSPTRYREDFRRGVVHRLVTPALERLAAQRIVVNEPALSQAIREARERQGVL